MTQRSKPLNKAEIVQLLGQADIALAGVEYEKEISEVRDAPKPPDHAFELVVTVGANTWDRVLMELNRLVSHIEEHGEVCNLVGGGVEVRIRKRDVTEEQYREELDAWLDEYHAYKKGKKEDGDG